MLLKIILILFAVVAVYLVFMTVIGLRIVRRFVHFPAPFFIGYFLDSDIRRKMQPPRAIMHRSGIRRGMKVLEIGCGSGAFTTYAAREAAEGRVFALDIQPRMLAQFKRKLRREENRSLANLQLIQGSAYDLPFDKQSLDLVFMVSVLMEIPDRGKALREVRRVLKSNGTLAVSEFLPDPDYPLKKTSIYIITSEGFEVDQVAGGLWNYTIRFTSR